MSELNIYQNDENIFQNDGNIFSNDPLADPVSDYLFKYKFDGTDSSLTRIGTDDYRLGPSAPEALCNWQDGATQYWNSADAALVQVGTGAYSFSFWFNVNSATNQCIINTGAGGGTNNFRIRIDGANGLLKNRTNGDIPSGSTNVVDGKWHHAVFTSAGSEGTYTWYLDGVADGTGSMPVYNYNTGASLQVGHRSTSQIPTGAIDDLRFYDRVLSVGEITALKNYRNDWTYEQITTVAVYDPSDISAANITELAGAVSNIADKGTAGTNDISQATGALQPTTGVNNINGLNVIHGDGTEYMGNASFPIPASGNCSFFGVFEIINVDNVNDSIFSCDAADQDFQIDAQGGLPGFDGRTLSDGLGGNFENWTDSPHNGPSIYNVEFDFTNNNKNAYVDGSSVTNNINTYTTKLATPQSLKMLANRAGLQILEANFGLFVVIEDCDTECREKLTASMAWTYGLQANLEASNPYKTTPPKRIG